MVEKIATVAAKIWPNASPSKIRKFSEIQHKFNKSPREEQRAMEPKIKRAIDDLHQSSINTYA